MATARANVGADKCWDGYKAKGTKKKNGKTVPNCVKEDEKLENIISQMRDTEEVDEGVAAAAKVAGRLAMRALTSKAAKKAAKKVGKSALAGATAGAAERAGEVAYDKTRNLGKKKDKCDEEYVDEGRAEDAQASLAKVKERQKVLDAHEKKTGKKLDIAKTPEHKSHKQNFPGAKRTGKKVPGAKETDLETHNRRVQTYIDRLKKHGKTTKQKRDDAAMAKHTSRFD